MSTLEFKLLPHQKNFIKSIKNTILVAGYGSGKSYSGTLKTILKKLQFPQHKVAYYLPSYGLIRDIAFDKFPSLLEELKLPYKLNKTDKELEIVNYGKIIFRTLSEPETIVGYETAYSLIDEADILPMEKMDLAYKKILARNRAIDNGNVDMVSTPESFKFLYAQCNSGHFEVIKAKTYDNKFLPPDYIAQLEAQYPEQLLKAYLNGEFVNLQTGTILYNFKREIHHSNEEYNGQSEIFVGQDFNIGGCVSIVYIKSGDILTAIDEIESYDTQQIITNIKNKYPNVIVSIFPDASGNQNKTSAPQTDINMLKNAGFKVFANAINPSVKDRYSIVNKRFEDNKLFINTNKCPKLTKAVEQHAYNDTGMPMKYNGPATVDDYTDACFEGNTLVCVNDKTMKFKDIPKQGTITRYDGTKVQYTNGGYIRHDDIFDIKLNNGIIIKATKHHKFLTHNGWIEAINLKGEVLCNTQLFQTNANISTDKTISEEQTSIFTRLFLPIKRQLKTKQENQSIEQYGNILTGKFLKVMQYITKMKTKLITIFLTLKLWKFQRTEGITAHNGTKTTESYQNSIFNNVLKKLKNGILVKMVFNGIEKTMKRIKTNCIKLKTLFAQFAMQNIQQSNTQIINIAQINAARRREEIAELIMKQDNADNVAKTLKSTNINQQLPALEVVEINFFAKNQPTYCLTVEKDSCFALDNGIVVSNCTYPIAFMYPITVKKPYVKVEVIPTNMPMARKFDIY